MRLHGALSYTARPIQSLLKDIPKDDLTELPWLRVFETDGAPLCCPVGLSAEESRFAQRVFQTLGTTDLDGQLQHLQVCIGDAAEQREAAHARAEQSAKAYTVTGICAGLCLALVLI